MATPLRKGIEPRTEETELTTADIARPQIVDTAGPKPAVAERNAAAERTIEGAGAMGSAKSETPPLFPENELGSLRDRWKEIQTNFVDEPRKAVDQADSLVASAMKRLAEVFAEERSNLEHQWDRGDSVSTEDLRVALQRYRSFFQRLLSV